MPKHTVTKTIHHDGKLYRKGETVELSAQQAKPLIAIGHVAGPSSKSDTSAAAPTPASLGKSTLFKLTVSELNDYAKARGIVVPEGSTKDQTLEAIGAVEV